MDFCQYGGKYFAPGAYDLCWTDSHQSSWGLPGLGDWLRHRGWRMVGTTKDHVKAGYVVFGDASLGPWCAHRPSLYLRPCERPRPSMLLATLNLESFTSPFCLCPSLITIPHHLGDAYTYSALSHFDLRTCPYRPDG